MPAPWVGAYRHQARGGGALGRGGERRAVHSLEAVQCLPLFAS